MFRVFAIASAVAVSFSSISWGAITASTVINYASAGEPTFNDPASVLGLPPRSGPFGDLTPFSPNFGADNILRLISGGSVTLRLSSVVPNTGVARVGVYSNIGVIDASADGSGLAGIPAGSFSSFPSARVEISADGIDFVPITTGLHRFDSPATGFTDTPAWTGYSPTGGQAPAQFDKVPPQAFVDGGLASLSGLTYPQMMTLLDGSAGGEWLDPTASGLASFEYVRFSVPFTAAPDVRMILDAVVVGFVPEPTTLAVVASLGALALRRR
jgi:hypothetical protein